MARLPRTTNCLVCGRDNAHGLKLRLEVEPATGVVMVRATPDPHHVGFVDVIHGGWTATVVDEAMAWAAAWPGKRFGFCVEMTNRFRKPVTPGRAVRVEARATTARSRLVETVASVIDEETGEELSSASGKYMPMSIDQHGAVCEHFVDEDDTREMATLFRG
ncbi:MAG: PaaI family thioesterase [Tepidisphaeraceae bacterium]